MFGFQTEQSIPIYQKMKRCIASQISEGIGVYQDTNMAIGVGPIPSFCSFRWHRAVADTERQRQVAETRRMEEVGSWESQPGNGGSIVIVMFEW